MTLLDKLERRFGRFAVPHVTLLLVLGQAGFFLLLLAQPEQSGLYERMTMEAGKVMAGEYWRLGSFVLIPPTLNPLFAFFAWYLFYLMGAALEGQWGAFRYNVFLLVGYAATVAVSFVTPTVPATSTFIGGSVFLAFAHLYPDFVIYVFFILPVKIKWLALITWIGYALAVLFEPWSIRLTVLASACNFFLFFGRDIVVRVRTGERRMRKEALSLAGGDEPLHRCAVCGITDKTHRQMEFRYCTDCVPARGYCRDHIDQHDHVVKR